MNNFPLSVAWNPGKLILIDEYIGKKKNVRKSNFEIFAVLTGSIESEHFKT